MGKTKTKKKMQNTTLPFVVDRSRLTKVLKTNALDAYEVKEVTHES